MSILLLLAVASVSEGVADFAISCFSKAKKYAGRRKLKRNAHALRIRNKKIMFM